jgi:hypothetical protein
MFTHSLTTAFAATLAPTLAFTSVPQSTCTSSLTKIDYYLLFQPLLVPPCRHMLSATSAPQAWHISILNFFNTSRLHFDHNKHTHDPTRYAHI